MAKLPLYLVLCGMILLLHESAALKQSLFLLDLRARGHTVSVRPDGKIVSSSDGPSLYSLFRVEIQEMGSLSSPSLTIESMATGRYICMDRKGRLLTRKGVRRPGGPGEESLVRGPPKPELCTFNTVSFTDFHRTRAVYMAVPNSNGTKGRFIAFKKDGSPRRLERRLSSLKMSKGIAITFKAVGDRGRVRDLINGTSFTERGGGKGSTRFNRGVRKCLRSQLQNIPQPRNMFRKVHACVRAETYLACLKRSRKARSTMVQDSKQRNPRDLRSSNTSSNSMESAEDACAHLRPKGSKTRVG